MANPAESTGAHTDITVYIYDHDDVEFVAGPWLNDGRTTYRTMFKVKVRHPYHQPNIVMVMNLDQLRSLRRVISGFLDCGEVGKEQI